MSEPNETLGREPIQLVEMVLPKCANTYGVAPCQATGGVGSECFNCRATCQSVDNYQAQPLAHLTPDRTLTQGETGTTDFNGEVQYFVNVDMRIPLEPTGVVFEVGGTGTGAAIYFLSGDLIIRAGDGSSATPTGAARLSFDPAAYLGKTVKLITQWTYDSGVDCTVEAWIFDPVELELTSIGSATSSTDPGSLFDTGGYGVGEVNGTIAGNEVTTDYNGTITALYMYDASGGLLGSDVVKNGTFDTDTDWIKGSGVTISGGAANATGAAQIVIQSGVFEVGESYLVEFDYNLASGLRLRINNSETNGAATLFDSEALSVGAGTISQVVRPTTGTVLAIEASGAFYTGTIDNVSVKKIGATLFPDQNAYRQKLFLSKGVKGEPDVGQPILPCLSSVGTIGTKINLSGADDDYKPLGRRATLDFTVQDFTHSDIGQDPYVATRLYDPFERSTFWRKWLARQKFGKVGARVRIYDGYAGQPLSAYNRRGYVMEETKINEDGLSFYCRDELARTELLKAQVPATSPGSLDVAIDATQTTLTMNGDFTGDYPASGTLRINDELMTYTSVSYAEPTTTFSGLVRGTDGSTASDHDADDSVQECRRLTGTVEEVITELLTKDAKIEAQLIDLAGLASEQDAYLGAYSLDTVVSEVTGVDTVLGWVCQECQVYIWWDERQQQIRIKAIRAVALTDITKTLSHEDNIVAGTFRVAEKPRQRLNSLTINYNPIDFAGDLGEVANFANALKVVNGLNSRVDQYGNVLQAKTLFSRFLRTNAEVSQTASRIANRYADVPFEARLVVDAKDRAIWTGDIVYIDTPVIVDRNGLRDVRRWLIIEAEEIDPGHSVQYTVADITLDGLIYFITEDGIGTYTPELFALGNAFITDNNGFNPDGTPGARIS